MHILFSYCSFFHFVRLILIRNTFSLQIFGHCCGLLPLWYQSVLPKLGLRTMHHVMRTLNWGLIKTKIALLAAAIISCPFSSLLPFSYIVTHSLWLTFQRPTYLDVYKIEVTVKPIWEKHDVLSLRIKSTVGKERNIQENYILTRTCSHSINITLPVP